MPRRLARGTAKDRDHRSRRHADQRPHAAGSSAGARTSSAFSRSSSNRAAENEDVKAVVLRINSPGGTVTCSDTMYQMVKQFREKTKKPVIANTQEVAASGAYYVACACDQIVAHPTSVIGSIGVIFETFEVSGAMSKLGIRAPRSRAGR